MGQILTAAVALGLLWSIMVIGVYITYRVLDIADLTVEGSITLGAAICTSMIRAGWSPVVGTALAFGAGMLAGLATGALHTKLKIPALLSGILTMIALWSVNLRVMGSANVSILRMPTLFTFIQRFGVSRYFSWIILGGLLALALVTALYWFFGTELGSAIRATGSNPNMVRAQGVHTDNMVIIGLMISNGLVALSGALIGQSQSFADIQMGMGSIVIGLASLIVGEVLFGKRGFYMRLLSVALGAIIYRIIIALVMELGMNPNDLKLFTALTVAAALSVPYLSAAVRVKRKPAGAARV
ncbi:MAG: ABC transporter permease [Oscillospiraceae bacterium]|jgi:putative ABC transport system permease protein|nr:ABC transporter permease [Oscillospiraceae bacterium]